MKNWGNPAYSKRKILTTERLIKLRERVAKAEIDRENKISKKHLDNINNIFTVIHAVFAMDQTIEQIRDWSRMTKQMRIKVKKDQIEWYKNLKSRLKNWDRSWLGFQMKFIGWW